MACLKGLPWLSNSISLTRNINPLWPESPYCALAIALPERNIGVSLDQYRASIGRWAAGRMKRPPPAPAPLQPDLSFKEETQTLGPILQCNICKQIYCVKLEEVPLLECALCGQGCQDTCILDLFGVLPAEQDNIGPEEAKTKINPVGLPGLHYRCRACENDIIPDKEAGLLKRETAHSRQESISSRNALVLETISQDDDSDQPQSTDKEAAVVDTQQSDPENTDGPEHHSGNHNPMDHQADDTTHGRNSNSRQAGERNVINICPYYRQGTCKHELLSPDSAPKTTTACSRLLKHGNKGPQGCTQGRSCTNFHPKNGMLKNVTACPPDSRSLQYPISTCRQYDHQNHIWVRDIMEMLSENLNYINSN